MVIKEIHALSKHCCAAKTQNPVGELPLLCQGSKCMAWRFVSPPVLTRTEVLGSSNVSRIIGGQAPTPEYSTEYPKVFHDFMLRALSHNKINALLIPQRGNSGGWQLSEAPGYDEEEGVLYSCQVRERDPDATGYCGMAGKPYYMGEA